MKTESYVERWAREHEAQKAKAQKKLSKKKEGLADVKDARSEGQETQAE